MCSRVISISFCQRFKELFESHQKVVWVTSAPSIISFWPLIIAHPVIFVPQNWFVLWLRVSYSNRICAVINLQDDIEVGNVVRSDKYVYNWVLNFPGIACGENSNFDMNKFVLRHCNKQRNISFSFEVVCLDQAPLSLNKYNCHIAVSMSRWQFLSFASELTGFLMKPKSINTVSIWKLMFTGETDRVSCRTKEVAKCLLHIIVDTGQWWQSHECARTWPLCLL